MSNVLTKYSSEELETIKNTVARGATDNELMLFLERAKAYGLNPFLNEIYFMKTGKGQVSVIASRDGYLKIAKQNPDYLSINSQVVCKKDKFEVTYQDGELNGFTHSFGMERGEIVGAWCKISSKSGKSNVFEYLPYSEAKQATPVWRKNPTLMMKKVAESAALRRFSGISGIYNDSEFGYDLDDEEGLPEQEVIEAEVQPAQQQIDEAGELLDHVKKYLADEGQDYTIKNVVNLVKKMWDNGEITEETGAEAVELAEAELS